MRTRRAAIAVCFALRLYSQAPDNSLSIRSNSRLVQVDVIAEDRGGRPVAGLSRDNFEVYDQGKRQQIRIFTRDVTSVKEANSSATTGHDVFTNMAETRTGPSAVTVILIDSLNTKWLNQAHARQQIIRFLRQIRPEDHIAIYSMGYSGFHVLHDFTQDASDLVAKLNGWNGEAAADKSNERTDIGAQLGEWLKGKTPEYVQSQQMGDAEHFGPEQSLKILTAIAGQLAGIPGRKNLIWISEGFPLVNWGSLLNFVFDRPPTDHAALKMSDPQSFENQMVAAMRAISDDNVAIYPVDAVCLYDPFFTTSSQDPSEAGMKALVSIHGREEVMADIAKKTGGRAFYETNDLRNAIRLAMDDSKSTYTLGYYPDTVELNGKFRILKVRVTGISDVRLRYRQGYIDSPEPVRNEGDRALRLQNAVWSPLDANAIRLSANIERTKSADHLKLKINAANLTFSANAATRIAVADIVIVQKDERGNHLDTVQQAVRVELNPERYLEIMKSGLLYSHDFALNPVMRSMRVVVADAHSSRLGSLTISSAGLVP